MGLRIHIGAALLQRYISKRIVKKFCSSGIVFDFSAILYYGKENALARFGHYYHSNGEINFVLTVTRDTGLPVIQRIMPGNIVFVSDISNFIMYSITVVIDKGVLFGIQFEVTGKAQNNSFSSKKILHIYFMKKSLK